MFTSIDDNAVRKRWWMARTVASLTSAIAMLAWSTCACAQLSDLSVGARAKSHSSTCHKGVAPTEKSVEASGPFAVDSYVVPNPTGYRGGTVSYPSNTEPSGCTRFGAVVLMPGMRGDQNVLSWLGVELASNGFIVLNVDPLGPRDSPDERATQILAALRQLVNLSSTFGNPISGKVDSNRLGVMGHSAGGGGALVAARSAMVKAAIAMAPWHPTITSFSDISSPTLVMTCQHDTVVPSNAYGVPIYDSITHEKAYAELASDGHFCVATGQGDKGLQSRLITSWMKRWLDRDARYTRFLCDGITSGSSGLQAWHATCPY